MKILWIGKYASEDIFLEMAEKGYKDPSAQVSQSNIIHAFDELKIHVDTLNAYNVPPDYKDNYVDSQKWSRTGYSKDVSAGYRKIKYVGHLFIIKSLKDLSIKWAEKNKMEDEIVIIVYGMQSTLMSAALEIKKIIPKSRLFLIVPDLPQYMSMSMPFVKKVFKKIDWQLIKKQYRLFDGFVLYTEEMAEFLGLPKDKWILMEGSLDTKDVLDHPDKTMPDDKISLMYSGRLDKKYGIMELLDAIEIIKDENIEFYFTGNGNAVEEITKRAHTDSRIIYLGFLPSREELLKKQQNVTMLVNMRLPAEEGSAYCFPSKIFEYLASGRPVLSFRLEGIPDEYYNYLIEMKGTSREDISKTINMVANMSAEERYLIGKKGREFVINEKNSMKQAKKIIEFIKLNI